MNLKKEPMNNLNIESVYQQIAYGIRELVEGEGSSGRILGMEVDSVNNAIVIELAEMSKAFQNTLIEEIKENLKDWRVNPFTEVVYEGNQKLVFYLKDEDQILKTYKSQM